MLLPAGLSSMPGRFDELTCIVGTLKQKHLQLLHTVLKPALFPDQDLCRSLQFTLRLSLHLRHQTGRAAVALATSCTSVDTELTGILTQISPGGTIHYKVPCSSCHTSLSHLGLVVQVTANSWHTTAYDEHQMMLV